jgi:hypothetical protein
VVLQDGNGDVHGNVHVDVEVDVEDVDVYDVMKQVQVVPL